MATPPPRSHTSTAMRSCPLVAIALAGLLGCSSGGGSEDGDAKKDAAPPADTIADGGGATCAGETGCPCKQDSDCEGEKCGEAGGQQVCLGEDLTLCAPCKDSAACKAGGLDGSACVDMGDAGAFCAPGCQADEDCPQGYTCGDSVDIDKGEAKRCLPATGACTCGAWAIATAASTVCHAGKSGGNGGAKCAGERACQADGTLTPCSAAPPAAETCNGLDDDCDGKTDGAGGCDDGVDCTKDACAGAEGCKHEPSDAACDDGNPCTDNACDLSAGCSVTELSGKCEDASLCTMDETCKGGVCVPGSQKKCDDGDACTTDACDATTGDCVHKEVPGCGAPAEKSCKGKCGGSSKDGSCYCDKQCKGFGDCCVDYEKYCVNSTCTSDLDCQDNNKCTINKCDTATKKCVKSNAPDGTDCGTGNKCVLQQCKAGSCGFDFKTCDDGDGCTNDTCVPSDGSCKSTPKKPGSYCNDGNPCSGPDKCDDGGACAGAPLKDGTNCSDGQACTSSDACASGKCAGKPDDAKCDDLNACTSDACVSTKGCVFTPAKEGATCQDGDKCTVSDVCQGGVCVGIDKCKVVFSEPFDCPAAGAKGSWTFAANPASSKPKWAIDATPSPPGYYSPKCSLNYNDGKSYPGVSGGTATSAMIKLPAQGPLKLTFRDLQDMESGSNYDKRFVEVSSDGFANDIQTLQLTNLSKEAKVWRLRALPLAKWLGKEIQVRYRFESVDNVSNDTTGWFVDDLRVVVDKLPDDLGCKVDHDCPFDGDPCTSMVCKAGKCATGTSSAPCEDGNKCTEGDACKAGKCVAGAKTNCDDGNVCTDDSCDPKTGCKHAPNKAPCDDGDACTAPETCLGGACIAAPKSCHDGNACTKDWCEPQTGSCKHDTVPGCKLQAVKPPYKHTFDCADGDNIFWDTDSAPTGPRWAIDATPLPPGYKSAKCSLNFNDGQGVGCVDGKPKTAKVGVEGWVYSPFFDTSAVPKGAALSALLHLGGSWSTILHHLELEASSDNGKTWKPVKTFKGKGSKGFVPTLIDLSAWAGKFFQLRWHFWTSTCTKTGDTGPFIDDFKLWDATCKADTDCDDANTCTTGSCDAATGKCSFAAKKDGADCDDGDACSSTDLCAKGACAGILPKDCDDANTCTADACDPESGTCGHVQLAKGTTCTDGEGCTQGDKCDDKGACSGAPVAAGGGCSDGKPCTDKDGCDGKGACAGLPVAAGAKGCSDGNSCTKNDKCDGKGGCAGGPVAAGGGCSDGDPCTVDACDGKGGCVGKAGTKCDDKDPCTLDTCIKTSATGSTCKHAPVADGGKCDDGDPCTGGDACAAGKCAGKGECTYTQLHADDMKCGSTGWVLEPAVPPAQVGWHIDGDPNPPGYKSAKCSLNYNNGKDYAGKTAGTATSAPLTLPSGVVDIALRLWSYHDVESGMGYDKRFVEISDDGFAKNVQSVQLDNGKNKGKWVQEKLSLLQWAGKTVKVRLRFDSVDSFSNGTKGWFVDDLLVEVGKKK